MGATTIEWTERTWNPIRGCALVSDGCRNCYAMKQAHRFSGAGQPYEGLTELGPAGPRWTGKVRLVDEALTEPLSWRKPRSVFVNSMSDLFHEGVPDAFIDRVFAVMALAPRHTFQILTKRPQRMLSYVAAVTLERLASSFGSPPAPLYGICKAELDARLTGRPDAEAKMWRAVRPAWPLPNVWLGVSVENQKAADERIPLLLQTPSAVRFLSCEPLLAPLNVRGYLLDFASRNPGMCVRCGRGHGFTRCPNYGSIARVRTTEDGRVLCDDFQRAEFGLHWVIVGGESGPRARPMHPDWARSLRDQCRAADVPFFFKQWGDWELGSRTPRGRGEIVLNDGRHRRRVDDFTSDDRYRWDTLRPTMMARVGKKVAGRRLDGEVWAQLPRAARETVSA